MCGRFSLVADPREIGRVMAGLKIELPTAPRYNIAPTQAAAVTLNDGKRELTYARWGLIPSWAKDPAIGSKMINARSETLAEKPSFRIPLARRRCLIWADGFYEWAAIPGSKSRQPVYINLDDGLPFPFAGLWDRWRSPDGEPVISTTIITTSANELMSRFHHRMPVILSPDKIDLWLDPSPREPEELLPLLTQFPSDRMRVKPVSTAVNNPAVDDARCLL